MKIKYAFLFGSMLLGGGFISIHAQKANAIDQWLTNADRSALFQKQSTALSFSTRPAFSIRYKGKSATTTLKAGSVATYSWDKQ